MFKVILIQTYDGLRHESVEEALRHLRKTYTEKICSIGRNIAELVEGQHRYIKITEFIDDNLELFNELLQIKADMIQNLNEREEN